MKAFKLVRAFFKMESSSGILLLCAAAVALILANSSASIQYMNIINSKIALSGNHFSFSWSVHHAVNDGLMSLFFLLIGLQLKHEWASGALSLDKKMLLPFASAFGGMVIPASIYALMVFSDQHALRGWGVPMATDIAFSLGVLSLFGKRVPIGLIFFLMILAIIDDAGAVMVIALFYSNQGSVMMWGVVAAIMIVLFVMGRYHITQAAPWCIGGGLLWWSLSLTGVHPVLSGVLLAMAMPATGKQSLVSRWIPALHPWVAFGVMPLFAWVNAGVSLHASEDLAQGLPVIAAITAGLWGGKPLGVLGVAALLVRCRLAELPDGVNMRMLIGVGFLCGIGFTMSLFIGTLAFENQHPVYLQAVRQGVLLGSFLSGVTGVVILWLAFRKKARRVC